jgi:hypothetical protein
VVLRVLYVYALHCLAYVLAWVYDARSPLLTQTTRGMARLQRFPVHVRILTVVDDM